MLEIFLAVISGGAVGFTLGLIGGGGSILATPLMLYVVGLKPHEAIGTGALAVSANAFANFFGHARKGNVRWRSAIIFAILGIAGATAGSTLGKVVNGNKLIFLFAILMIVVGVLMLRRRPPTAEQLAQSHETEHLTPKLLALVSIAALVVGALSGFFGIGGGFLIVPGLLFSTGMPMIFAIGSSLLSVGTFGLTTAVNYSVSGFVDWRVAIEFIGGGVAGGLLGTKLAVFLAPRRAALNRVFAGLVFIVAIYMLYRNAASFGMHF
ncbi:MAG: sulfite exporter TauE/SafE family protein [Acidiphilium sp.]|nr:sulfite exporter TauE/SafE family protein [Acidiphilium sp.]MDD4934624.1 sulfite exporter TauE/SafE family protein [Acidiphilium sp.]